MERSPRVAWGREGTRRRAGCIWVRAVGVPGVRAVGVPGARGRWACLESAGRGRCGRRGGRRNVGPSRPPGTPWHVLDPSGCDGRVWGARRPPAGSMTMGLRASHGDPAPAASHPSAPRPSCGTVCAPLLAGRPSARAARRTCTRGAARRARRACAWGAARGARHVCAQIRDVHALRHLAATSRLSVHEPMAAGRGAGRRRCDSTGEGPTGGTQPGRGPRGSRADPSSSIRQGQPHAPHTRPTQPEGSSTCHGVPGGREGPTFRRPPRRPQSPRPADLRHANTEPSPRGLQARQHGARAPAGRLSGDAECRASRSRKPSPHPSPGRPSRAWCSGRP